MPNLGGVALTSSPDRSQAVPTHPPTDKPSSESELARELAAEQATVDWAYRCLRKAVHSARQIDSEAHRLFKTDRSDWHREEAGTALFERDAFAFQAARRLAILDAEHEGLVFGRLDLTGDEVRHIGRLGVRDDDFEPLVIDWRAPAAEPFYRATFSDPMGVARRRVLHCLGEKVVGIEDDLLDAQQGDDLAVLGEGALLAALTRARGATMRDIVATIQAEQDEAIRAPHQGVTIIAGGPGTGKTVVALHRAAYLLYTHRRRFTNGGVLIVGPSMIFMRYIGRVLPGLGEDAVALKALGQVAGDVLDMESSRYDDAEVAALKGSLRMLTVLRRLVSDPLAEAAEAQQLSVAVKGVILTVRQAELVSIRRRVLAGQKSNRALEPAGQAVLNALWAIAPAEVTDEVDRTVFDDIVRGQARWQMFMQAWWPVLDAEQVLARLAEPRVMARVADGVLSTDEQKALTQSLADARGYAPGLGLPRPEWTIADMALLDELIAMIGPSPVVAESRDPEVFIDPGDVEELVTTADILSDGRNTETDADADPQETFSHILVDESQDVTPMQWRMLRRRGPQASWTIVGDPAQSSFPDPSQVDKAINELIGRGPSRRFRLATNYRSPQEVFDLAGRYIVRHEPTADLPKAIRATGVNPEFMVAPAGVWRQTLQEILAEAAAATSGTIGVIVPLRRYAEIEDMELPEDATVVTALEAKGMEYDVVIVVAPDEIVAQTPGAHRVLYVALTRPTQRLITLDLDAPGAWRESLA